MRHALHLAACLLALALGGCASPAGKQVANSVSAMGGAQATGAGGSTMTAPPAAAEPSEQHAVEVTVYQQEEPSPVEQIQEPPPPVVEFHADPMDTPAQPAAVSPPLPAAQPRPLYRRVETHTKLGAQQEVAPMLKQAGEFFGRLNKAHWLGILGLLASIGGILHSAGNKESGYPLCWLKVMGGSTLAIVMGDALWFWILLALAGLLYAGQKLGIIRTLPLP